MQGNFGGLFVGLEYSSQSGNLLPFGGQQGFQLDDVLKKANPCMEFQNFCG